MQRLVIALCLIFSLGGLVAAQDPESVATLEPYQGLVQIQRAGEDDWQTITDPMPMTAGDAVRTDLTGWAALTFFDGASTEILPDTHLVIDRLEAPATPGGSFQVSLSLLVGDTFNTVGQVLDAESGFTVEMPGMTASVRGTSWYNRVLPTGCSVAFVEEGEVLTFSALNEGNPIAVPAGEFLVYNLDGSLDGNLAPEFPTPRPEALEEPFICGDGVCAADETCSLDCAPDLPDCGDGVCDRGSGESQLTCTADCAAPAFTSDSDLLNRLQANDLMDEVFPED